MRCSLLPLIIVSVLLCCNSSCEICNLDDWAKYRSQFEKTYSVSTPCDVKVDNSFGLIHAVAWDKNEILVKGVMKVRAKDDGEARARLKDVSVVVS
ncbi:MAG: hypothetical protein V2A71_04215, partial [Candidatus Eisenbacteria bacterium]